MIRVLILLTCLGIVPTSTFSQELPPGVMSAQLLPGWTDSKDTRITALKLELEPGWKTYWRSPGNSGFPPIFGWNESENLTNHVVHWPVPKAIGTGDSLALGYQDTLILPISAAIVDTEMPVKLKVDIQLGVCERICVPVYLSLTAPEAANMPDPLIEHALLEQPTRVAELPICSKQDIDDGIRLNVTLPKRPTTFAAMEVTGEHDIWVSSTALKPNGDSILASADFVELSGKPFDLDTSRVLITQAGNGGAIEMMGCQQQ